MLLFYRIQISTDLYNTVFTPSMIQKFFQNIFLTIVPSLFMQIIDKPGRKGVQLLDSF